MSDLKEYNIYVCGVGGQGILTLTDILGEAGLKTGYKVRGSETHGMAQRGGSVVATVKYGTKVHSPLVPEKGADILISLEPAETLRSANYVKEDGLIITGTFPFIPPSNTYKREKYPEIDQLLEKSRIFCSNVYTLDFAKAIADLGSVIVANVVALGAISMVPNFPVTEEVIRKTIIARWPKFVELNLKAFEYGQNMIKEQLN